MRILSPWQRPNAGAAVSCLTATSSVPLPLATSRVPCDRGIKERTGSKPLQECCRLRSESGRWCTYYAGPMSKVLLPLVVLRREGYISLPPAPAQAWKRLPARVLQAGRRMRQRTRRGRSRVPCPGCAAAAPRKSNRNTLAGGKENPQWNHQNFQHASCGKGSQRSYLVRAMMWKVKLKTNEAKARKRYVGELPKPVIITFHREGSCRDWHARSHPLPDGQYLLLIFHNSTLISKCSGSWTYAGRASSGHGRERISWGMVYTTAQRDEDVKDQVFCKRVDWLRVGKVGACGSLVSKSDFS